MADEKEKLEIDDIKDPEGMEELDIDDVVSEEAPEEKKEPKEEVAEEEVPVTESEEDAVLEKPAKEPKSVKPKKSGKKDWVKYLIIGVVIALVAAAAVMGVIYYLDQKNNIEEVADTNQKAEVETDVALEEGETEEVAEKSLYISSEVGLNLRETPDTKAKVLIIIPYATKIVVLEEQTGWIKTIYDNKTGWVSTDYTQATSPLVYENETYGFGLTFKVNWAGYKFFEANNADSTTVKTYYVALPTTDAAWDETTSGITKGYASLFVIGIYTKAEWAEMAGGKILPAKLGEGDKYVYTYLPGQTHATDLRMQYGEIGDIIKTFKVLS